MNCAWRTALVLTVFGVATGIHAQKPAVVLAEGKAVVFAGADGKVTRRIPLSVEVDAVVFSRETGRLVIQTKGEWGGRLYLVDPKTGVLRGLLPYPIYFKNLTAKDKEVPESERERINREEHEVYADPEFDPTGNLLVFAVHDSGPGAWDLVLASGPLAVLDLRTGQARVLESTLLKSEQGPAFANNPQWSADGTRILWNHEAGSELADAAGRATTDISGWFELRESEMGFGVAWIDHGSILYAVYPEAAGAPPARFSVLDLATRHSRPAAESLGIKPDAFNIAKDVQVSDTMILIREFDNVSVYDRNSHRLLFSLPHGKGPVSLVR